MIEQVYCLPITDGGVVILDDPFNADWPDVYLGLALYLEGHLYEQLQASRMRSTLLNL